MKLKKYLSSLLALALLASCSNEGILDNNNTNEDVVPEGVVAFNVSLPGRTFEPATYAGTFAAEVAEKSLTEVRIYVFDNTSANKPGKLIATEKVTSVGTGNTEAGVTGKFYMRHLLGAKAHLVAAANLDLTADQANALIGTTFENFSKEIITQSPSTANKFPMVSDPLEVTVPKTGTTTPANITFLLERLAVRIDIKNETNKTGTNKEFVLEDVRTKVGSLSQSYLIKGQTPVLAKHDALGTKEVGTQTWIANTPAGNKEMFAKVYTYENGNTNFVLEVRGKIDSKPAAFEIPFGKKLIRNTRYLVKIQNAGLGNLVKFDVEVVDWKDGGNVVVGSDSYASTKPLVKSVVVANSTGVATGTAAHTTANASGNINAITLTKRDAYHTRVLVTSDVESKITVTGAMVPWVTVKEVALTPAEEAANFGAKAYHIAFAKNEDTYDRTAQLVVEPKDNTDTAKQQIVTVTQKGATYAEAVNPLALFANSYLNGMNTFAAPFTEENMLNTATHGKIFQWGRNTPLDPTKPVLGNAKVLKFTDPEIKTPAANTMYGKGIENWSQVIPATTDTWATFAKKAVDAGAASWRGTNSIVGDPSPETWRVPNSSELLSFLPSHTSIYLADRATIITEKAKKENIQFKAATKEYNADYKFTDNNIFYAIKMKKVDGKSDNTKLTAYRYELKHGRGLIITARHLGNTGATTTIEQVSNENWWSSNSGSDVVRIFPRAIHTNRIPQTFSQYALCFWSNDSSRRQKHGMTFLFDINTAQYNWGDFAQTNAYYILPIRVK